MARFFRQGMIFLVFIALGYHGEEVESFQLPSQSFHRFYPALLADKESTHNHHPSTNCCRGSSSLTRRNAFNVDNEDNDEKIIGPEKSRMYDYVADFLAKSSFTEAVAEEEEEEGSSSTIDSTLQEDDVELDDEEYTHLIAIPMNACHELQIELESVQRGIMYHCPVLVHSCIVPAKTRLPLLYVKAPSTAPSVLMQTTAQLHEIVRHLVQKQMFVPTHSSRSLENTNDETSDDNDDDDDDDDDEDSFNGPNKDGIRPLLINFQSLEIDGPNNSVLNTVAVPDDPGTRQLQSFVLELQTILNKNWKTRLPKDQHVSGSTVFRPRLPFMRIPPDFSNYLEPVEVEGFRTSDQGGNGISPIFWCEWWDDAFGEQTRLQEVGVYPRTGGRSKNPGLTEDTFALPYQLVDLPKGNTALTREEAKFEDYQEQRMVDAEEREKKAQKQGAKSRNQVQPVSNDRIMTRTTERLTTMYQNYESDSNSTMIMMEDDIAIDVEANPDKSANPRNDEDDIVVTEGLVGVAGPDGSLDDILKVNPIVPQPTSDTGTTTPSASTTNLLDDWTRERIKEAIENRQTVKSKQSLQEKKDKPSIENNPVFKSFKEGTLVPKKKTISQQQQQQQQKPQESLSDLPPFPSREHLVGFWKVLSSPTGFRNENEMDKSKSDNLILRVDGTTAGGPILDMESRQKAAGGTWRMFDNSQQDVGNDDDSDDDTDKESCRLRIRLVIPPKKDRILVMDGTVKMSSMALDLQMPRGTFGIPELEERYKQAQEDEKALCCNGKVWIEDALTGKNRDDVGIFSLMKLETSTDPNQYTITIPKPVRNQD